MAVSMKKCKVCGCEYEYCRTQRHIDGVFRWQDVACSPEHGSIYLARIEASRTNESADDGAETDDESENIIVSIEDNDTDKLFEEYSEDAPKEIAIEK